jgi:hypothetical protein
MAHFAEIDSNGIVLRVLVACNQDIANNGGEQSKQAAEHFGKIAGYSSNGVKWVQTSFNNNFRKQFAGIGYYYDLAKDKFIRPQPYPSWNLDENDNWKSPISYPTIKYTNKIIDENDGKIEYQHYKIRWDESNIKWTGSDENNNPVSWNPITLSWE